MLEIAAQTRLSRGEQSFRELWLLLKREEQGERRKVMLQLMARARSVLVKLPPLSSRTFEGQLQTCISWLGFKWPQKVFA